MPKTIENYKNDLENLTENSKLITAKMAQTNDLNYIYISLKLKYIIFYKYINYLLLVINSIFIINRKNWSLIYILTHKHILFCYVRAYLKTYYAYIIRMYAL